ncbi:MAG: aminoacyl-tRNA hydrolase [Ignavibacteriae bacterium]|nr:MAG: aminoacyl-tRNA hydrolase [Ignavibacteriota bacterium]
MLIINEEISIDENELEFSFVKASGPGGQNINKVATSVQLRFNVAESKSINEKVKILIFKNSCNKLTKNNEILIEAKRFRTQEKNKKDALERFKLFLLESVKVKKKRKKTLPTTSSVERRIETKKKRANIKKLREKVNKKIQTE